MHFNGELYRVSYGGIWNAVMHGVCTGCVTTWIRMCCNTTLRLWSETTSDAVAIYLGSSSPSCQPAVASGQHKESQQCALPLGRHIGFTFTGGLGLSAKCTVRWTSISEESYYLRRGGPLCLEDSQTGRYTDLSHPPMSISCIAMVTERTVCFMLQYTLAALCSV